MATDFSMKPTLDIAALTALKQKQAQAQAELDQKYSQHFAKIDTKKKDVIRNYANELEHDGEMELEMSKHITQVLKGYVTDRYVQQG